jgi:UDP-glucose 4-epimerase
MLELAERVRRLTASESAIALVAYDAAYEEGFEDMPRRVPDTGKIHSAIGWSSTRALDATLADVIAFHQAETSIV